MDGFLNFSKEYVPLIDGCISSFYKSKVKNAAFPFMKHYYRDLAAYSSRPGKRVRPLVMLASYSGYKKGKSDMEEAVKLAAAVELMHSFLLVQDDIIDRSESRRGGSALHVMAGERMGRPPFDMSSAAGVAVVLADVIFSNALELVASAEICNRARRRFLSVFASTYEMTAWGQVLDIEMSSGGGLGSPKDTPLTISKLKTAYYTIMYPLLMGRVLAGPDDPAEEEAIRAFAIPLGMAFQIRDDLLGVFGAETETGKPSDSDLAEGKMTLLIQNAIDAFDSRGKEAFLKLFLSPRKTEAGVKKMRRLIVESGAHEKTAAEHDRLIEEAAAALPSLSLSKKAVPVFQGLVGAVASLKGISY